MTEQAVGFDERYGPWAVVAGASDGTGAAFAEELARRGVTWCWSPGAGRCWRSWPDGWTWRPGWSSSTSAGTTPPAPSPAATADLDVGLFVYNAGADSANATFLAQPVEDLLALTRRNCDTVLACSHHFGGRLVERGRGGLVLVSSGAAWVGGSHVAAYGATKAFDLVLAEALWAEWRDHGVDVLALVLGATDTPSLRAQPRDPRRRLRRPGRPRPGGGGGARPPGRRADLEPRDARPRVRLPLRPAPRRQAVELMSSAASVMFDDGPA